MFPHMHFRFRIAGSLSCWFFAQLKDEDEFEMSANWTIVPKMNREFDQIGRDALVNGGARKDDCCF